jgi:hypothetical protein
MSPLQRKTKREELLEVLKGIDGKDAEPPTDEHLLSLIKPLIPEPIKGDKPTKEEILALVKPLIPKVQDGKTPTDEELRALIVPLIPQVKNGEDGKDGSPDTPDEVVEKVNKAKKKIKSTQIEDLDDRLGSHKKELDRDFKNNIRNIQQRGGPSQLLIKQGGVEKGRAPALNFTNATVTTTGQGDSATINITTTGSGSSPLTTKGDVYTHDSSADTRLAVGNDGEVLTADSASTNGIKWAAVSGGSFSLMVPTGTVDGSNTSFVFTSAPSVIVLDNANIMNKQSSDGTVNWTGTTSITLTQSPNSNIFGF